MLERRKKMMKRMVFEELERREMLTSAGDIAMAASALQNGSYEDFYRSQVGTELGGNAGVGMLDSIQAANNMAFRAPGTVAPAQSSPFAETASAVGQLTLTTGANTPGIGSFAMPTAGPSRSGGTGNASPGLAMPTNEPQAVDAAIESLFGDDAGKVAEKEQPEESRVSERKTGRRAFGFDPKNAEAPKQEEKVPVGAGR
jgi:hypothetical protein